MFTLPIGVNLYQFYLSAAISLLSFVKTKRCKKGVWGLPWCKRGGGAARRVARLEGTVTAGCLYVKKPPYRKEAFSHPEL